MHEVTSKGMTVPPANRKVAIHTCYRCREKKQLCLLIKVKLGTRRSATVRMKCFCQRCAPSRKAHLRLYKESRRDAS